MGQMYESMYVPDVPECRYCAQRCVVRQHGPLHSPPHHQSQPLPVGRPSLSPPPSTQTHLKHRHTHTHTTNMLSDKLKMYLLAPIILKPEDVTIPQC